ncbi:hypothetical protein PG984_011308 [Apiospora sp. TS-2023a]
MADRELLSNGDALITHPPPSWTSVNNARSSNRASRTRSSACVNVCDQCYRRKLGCSRAKPACDRCHQAGRQCTYSLNRPAGRPRRSNSDRACGTSFAFSQPNEARRVEAEKDLYIDPSQPPEPTSRLPSYQTIPPAQDPSRGDLTSPTLVGSSSSESVFFIDPVICTKPPQRQHCRSASDGKATRPLSMTHERMPAPDRTHRRDNPPSSNGSADDLYRNMFPPGSQSDVATFDSSVSSGQTDRSTQQMASHLEAEIMDFDFDGSNQYTMEQDASDTDSVAASIGGGEGCFCLADLVQSLEAKTDLGHTKAGSLEVVRRLNEASERLIHCEEPHSGILYSMLLALYEDAEACLSPVRAGGPKSRPDGETTGGLSHGKTTTELISNMSTSIVFKAFTALSTVAAALPFKPGTNIDKLHQDVVIAYAQKLRNKFGGRLMEIRAVGLGAVEDRAS